MDEAKVDKEFDDMEMQELLSNENIKSVISSANKTYRTIKLGDTDINIKQYMPKKVRHTLIQISHNLESATEGDLESIEAEMYPLVASMCVDNPFTKASTWKYLDNETGCIQDVLIKIANEVSKTDSDIKSFRRK